jgi:hypothetical protein
MKSRRLMCPQTEGQTYHIVGGRNRVVQYSKIRRSRSGSGQKRELPQCNMTVRSTSDQRTCQLRSKRAVEPERRRHFLQDHRTVCATGRRLYFRNRSLAASIIRAWTVVSRSRASCRSAFSPSGLILVKMPRAATGAPACAAFALPCRLNAMTPTCPLPGHLSGGHYRGRPCNASWSTSAVLPVCISHAIYRGHIHMDSLLA